MPALPTRFVTVILAFSGLFHQRTWRHAERLLIGAILAPGIRTVAGVLRVLGLADERHFVNYHRVLSRAVWSPRAASRVLLGLLVHTFVPRGPIVLGLDDTIERRRGGKIHAKGIFRDPVRSSHSHFVKASGLRWLSVMLLTPVPWARRVWALPFLTALSPSECYHQERGLRHKRLTDYARQLLLQARRWLPSHREVIMVADSGFAALELLNTLREHMTSITRFRMDAQLYEPAPYRAPGTNGRPRKKGSRLPKLAHVLEDPRTRWQRVSVRGWYGEAARVIELATGTGVWYHAGMPVLPVRWVLVRDPRDRFDPQALLSTDLALSPVDIVRYYVRRWQVEVTFEETRRHLGVETQREWSDLAIARTTPILLALFSLVTLLAAQLPSGERRRAREAAWYRKPVPTFSDALALVRRQLWRELASDGFATSKRKRHMRKPEQVMIARFSELLCYAA